MKALTVFGIILMLLGFAIMAFLIVIPAVLPSLDDAPIIKNTLQTLLCKPGDNLTADYSSYSTPTSSTRSMDLSCVNSENQSYDVSGQGILIGMVGFMAPFLSGLFMTIAGAARQKRQAQFGTSGMFTPGTSGRKEVSFNRHGLDVTVEPNGEVIVKTPDGKIYTGQQGNILEVPGLFGHTSLAERLSELKSAYEAGLISEAEYEAKRKDLLNQV